MALRILLVSVAADVLIDSLSGTCSVPRVVLVLDWRVRGGCGCRPLLLVACMLLNIHIARAVIPFVDVVPAPPPRLCSHRPCEPISDILPPPVRLLLHGNKECLGLVLFITQLLLVIIGLLTKRQEIASQVRAE